MVTTTAITITTTAAITTTATAAATTAFFAGSGFIHDEVAAVHFISVEHFNGFMGFLIGTHLDETESA